MIDVVYSIQKKNFTYCTFISYLFQQHLIPCLYIQNIKVKKLKWFMNGLKCPFEVYPPPLNSHALGVDCVNTMKENDKMQIKGHKNKEQRKICKIDKEYRIIGCENRKNHRE